MRRLESDRAMSASTPVTLSPEDIPGTALTEPYTKHTVAPLRWWLTTYLSTRILLLTMMGPSLPCRAVTNAWQLISSGRWVRTKSEFRTIRAHNGEIGALTTVTLQPFVPSTSNRHAEDFCITLRSLNKKIRYCARLARLNTGGRDFCNTFYPATRATGNDVTGILCLTCNWSILSSLSGSNGTKVPLSGSFPDIIFRFGPPRSYWCMRFEAKNCFFKDVIHGNFKNIPYTLAFEHQLWLCHQLYSAKKKENFLYIGDEVKGDITVNFRTSALYTTLPDAFGYAFKH